MQTLDVLPALLQEGHQEVNTHVDVLHIYQQVDFLILDDMGTEKITDWVNEKLYQIINYRYENFKSTVLTTNLSGDQLADRLGERIPSRIAQMCLSKKMEDKDYRLTNR